MTTNTRTPQPGEAIISASGKLHTYGYHNTFTGYALALPDTRPPSYDYATSQKGSEMKTHQGAGLEILPGYSNNVHFEGFLDVRSEFSNPFLVSLDNDWHTVYVILHGTQLSVYRLKNSLFRSRSLKQGRLLKTYSLQHAEIGIATDFRKGELIPRGTFARMLPAAAQLKLYETDPHLFEPIREFVFRIRIETEQMIFCAPTHEVMLDWVEEICVGIDISPPLDDRSEPRYRSLPRRTRRQRQIEATAQTGYQPSRQELERRVVAEQEAIIRRLYPNLAGPSPAEQATNDQSESSSDRENSQDADGEEFDPADANGEINDTSLSEPSQRTSMQSVRESYDPKTAHPIADLTLNGLSRFRRRCAPILLASSPRASPIIFADDRRYQIDMRRCQLVPFEKRPPKYDMHTRPLIVLKEPLVSLRPGMSRGISGASGDSMWSNMDIEEEESSSLHTVTTVTRFDSSNEELAPISVVTSTESGRMGKGKAVPRLSFPQPLKALGLRYDEASAAALGPLLV